MTDVLYFAQISDIHISSLGDRFDMLSGRSAGFLSGIIAELSRVDDLDFVLITGDLFDTASQEEFDRFQQVICTLKKPYYIIPGNHDRREVDSPDGLTRHQFAYYFNPQFRHRPNTPEEQVGYWSATVSPQVQLIGLDSTRDQDWGGIIDGAQFEWLKRELTTHSDKLVILAVHHPLHALTPMDQQPKWANFVCDNGSEVLTFLDLYPQVKVVLTGHHHVTKVDNMFDRRLHLACPALAIYPCAYRTFRLGRQSNSPWSIAWQTHSATNSTTIAEARERMISTWLELGGFEKDFVMDYVDLVLGDEHDRNGKAILK
jgi:3',5'-cyclic AMP phosphodiesterase CpdA